MEELHKYLRKLEKMTHELDCISGFVYVLKDALWQNEDSLNVQYSMASFYISERLIEFEQNLDELLEHLFDSYRDLSQ